MSAAKLSPAVFRGPAELRAAVGRHLGPTTWLTVGRARVDRFLAATSLAVASANGASPGTSPSGSSPSGTSPTDGAIRLGPEAVPVMLVLSLSNYVLSRLVEVRDVTAGVNYGTGQVRFPNALPVGGRIRGRAEVLDVVDVPGGVQSTVRITLETDAGSAPLADVTPRAVCVVDTLSRYLA